MTVTDIVPNKPEASLVTLAVPFAWVADAGSGVATGDTGSTVFTGHATIEVEALDSDSNLQLVAFIETEAGKKCNWAHLLRVRLDAAHGITDKKQDHLQPASRLRTVVTINRVIAIYLEYHI